MCDKMATYAHILKIVENSPFLRLQMSSKEMFNRHQNVKLKLMQNETNQRSIFLVKTKY